MTLFSKYPELGPLSLLMPMQKGKYIQHQKLPTKSDCEMLVIFGLFEMSEDLKTYLNNHPKTHVVFMIDSLAELLFFSSQGMDNGFDEERIHAVWKEEDDETWIQTLVSRFPYTKVEFLQNDCDDERFEFLKKTILRKIVLESSVSQELSHYTLLCQNLFSNVFKLSKAFDIGKFKGQFKGVPAIICGAGPSLNAQKEMLKSLEDKALIFAGGTTISVLSQMGIEPHMAFAMDPNKEEYDRLRQNLNMMTPLIYGTRVQKDIFRCFAGAYGYLKTDTGGLFETHIDEALGVQNYGILENLSDEALSVTMIALMTAIYLGCETIYFAGVDLSFKKDQRYSGQILRSWENALKKDDLRPIKWMMEKDVVDDVAAKHPEISFYDATGDGLTFRNVKVKRFNLSDFRIQESLKGKIDNLILNSKFDVSYAQISKEMSKVKESIDELARLIENYLNGDLVYTLFSFQIGEILAFKLFFQGMYVVLKGSYKEENSEKQIFAHILKDAKKLSSLIKF